MLYPKIVNFHTIATRAPQTSVPNVQTASNAPQLRQKWPALPEKSASRVLQERRQAVVPTTKIVSTFRQFAPTGNTGPAQLVKPVRKIKLVFLEEPLKRSPQASIHQQESTLNSYALAVTTAQTLITWLNAQTAISVKKPLRL